MIDFVGAAIAIADLISADFQKIPEPSEFVLVPRPVEIKIGGYACNVSSDFVQFGLSHNQVTTVISIKKNFFENSFPIFKTLREQYQSARDSCFYFN